MGKTEGNLSVYVVTLVLSTIIFVAGLLLGVYFSNVRVDEVEIKNMNLERHINDIGVETLLYNENPTDLCEFLQDRVLSLTGELFVLEGKIISIESERNLNSENFLNVKKDYTLSLIKYYVFSQNVKQQCNNANFSIIVYFYSKDCDKCEEQGYILSYLKSVLKNRLLIIPIDADLDLSSINLLKNIYGVKKYPTIVIDSEVHNEFKNKSEMLSILCEKVYFRNDIICS